MGKLTMRTPVVTPSAETAETCDSVSRVPVKVRITPSCAPGSAALKRRASSGSTLGPAAAEAAQMTSKATRVNSLVPLFMIILPPKLLFILGRPGRGARDKRLDRAGGATVG